MIVQADALQWLQTCEPAALILTDPPHLGCFPDPVAHLDFAREWTRLARLALAPEGVLLHSCGPACVELRNYFHSGEPDSLLVWRHDTGHHFFLLYGSEWREHSVLDYHKPWPLYEQFIEALCPVDGLVVDPFCGHGEIPQAARLSERRYAGCDLNARSIEFCHREGL